MTTDRHVPIILFRRRKCPEGESLQQFLLAREVSFQEVDIDGDPDAATLLAQKQGGEARTPALLLGTGLFLLTQPSERAVQDALRRVGYSKSVNPPVRGGDSSSDRAS